MLLRSVCSVALRCSRPSSLCDDTHSSSTLGHSTDESKTRSMQSCSLPSPSPILRNLSLSLPFARVQLVLS